MITSCHLDCSFQISIAFSNRLSANLEQTGLDHHSQRSFLRLTDPKGWIALPSVSPHLPSTLMERIRPLSLTFIFFWSDDSFIFKWTWGVAWKLSYMAACIHPKTGQNPPYATHCHSEGYCPITSIFFGCAFGNLRRWAWQSRQSRAVSQPEDDGTFLGWWVANGKYE